MTRTESEVGDLIKNKIKNNEFLPNERLVESSLAKEFQVKRGTVRQALIQLENERLIERKPNIGARVKSLTLDEVIEITEVRYYLEPFVAQKAAKNITEEQIKELGKILKQMEKAYKDLDFVKYSESNRVLHNQIYESAKHPTSTRILNNLRAQSVRYQFKLSLVPNRIHSSFQEHEQLVLAIIKKDGEKARLAMKQHLQNMLKSYKTSNFQLFKNI